MKQLGKLPGVGQLVLVQLQFYAGVAGFLKVDTVVQQHKVVAALAIGTVQPGKTPAQFVQAVFVQALLAFQKAFFVAAAAYHILFKHLRSVGRLDQVGALTG